MSTDDNVLKTPLALSLNRFASRRVGEAIQLTGKALPCSVSEVLSSGIVRVNFEVDAGPWTLPRIVVPVGSFEWVRYPIQVGTYGVVFPADARLGGLTGLGAGTPKIGGVANLAALTFFGLGSSNWTDAEDPDALELYGVNSVIIRSPDGDTKITVSDGGVVIDLGGPITINSGGNNVTVSGGGDVLAGTISLKTHVHSGVTTGGGSSGPPV